MEYSGTEMGHMTVRGCPPPSTGSEAAWANSRWVRQDVNGHGQLYTQEDTRGSPKGHKNQDDCIQAMYEGEGDGGDGSNAAPDIGKQLSLLQSVTELATEVGGQSCGEVHWRRGHSCGNASDN